MRASRARRSPRGAGPVFRWAGPLLAVIAVVAVCGFTLYWTQSKLDAVSARLDGMEHTLKAAVGQNLSSQQGQQGSSSNSSGPAETGTTAAGVVRLARIVKCDASGNLVTVTYDPAQLFTGPDAVKIAASRGDAVTGGAYIFDPTADAFTGVAPVKAVVTLDHVPEGWTGSSPKTIAELATDLQAAGGQLWSKEYFWLRFNAEYLVSIQQYQGSAAP